MVLAGSGVILLVCAAFILGAAKTQDKPTAGVQGAGRLALGTAEPAVTQTGLTQTELLFYLLRHPDPSLPKVVAIANGAAVPSSDYGGHFALIQACIETVTCPARGTEEKLGAANIALTAAVDDVLLEQYGIRHGIQVSNAEVTAFLKKQATSMQEALKQDGVTAAAIRQTLELEHLNDPSQIVTNPFWQENTRLAFLRGKTQQAFANIAVPPLERGTPPSTLAQEAFKVLLQKHASVQIKIGAHLLNPKTMDAALMKASEPRIATPPSALTPPSLPAAAGSITPP